jgi:hypothetical protein
MGLPYVDLSQPRHQARAARNLRNMYDATPDEVKHAGSQWYPLVHDATVSSAKDARLTDRQGAGIVAAVSPNMDWDKNNISAFDELRGLKGRQWSAIRDSANGSDGRSRAASDALEGLGVSSATDSALMRAHSIMQGRDFEDVLPRRTAPKTNSFAHNILDPHHAGPVTIDGRAHDIAADQLRGWRQGRGIESADNKTGKPTRYEHFETAYRMAAMGLAHPYENRDLHPHELQSITWVHGKALENKGLTKSGQPRKVGVRRTGQSYSSLM